MSHTHVFCKFGKGLQFVPNANIEKLIPNYKAKAWSTRVGCL